MEEICRLCCSSNFVRNDIFDEETALHLKMSLYMPIKVFRGDQLPQKICDRCSCRVNDLYQFCNEAIEVQNKLRAALLATGLIVEQCVDLTMVKDCHSPPPLISPIRCERSTQTDELTEDSCSPNKMAVKIKEEPREPTPPPQIKPELNLEDDNFHIDSDFSYPGAPSDSSEDQILINLRRKKKRKKHKETQNGEVVKRKRGRPKLTENGEVGKHKTGKRGRPRKEKPSMGELEMLISVLPEGTTIGVVDKPVKTEVKEEEDSDGFTYDDLTTLKQELVEPDRYYCCICFKKYKYSRSEMMKHYRDHAYDDDLPEVLPEPPPVPQEDPSRCPRCVKMVAASQWKEHWRRHFVRDRRPYRCALCEKAFRDPVQIIKHGELVKLCSGTQWKEHWRHHFVRDRRPYRCALCEKAFRDPVQIIKHGQSHAEGPKKEDSSESQSKRFVCDLCPEAFVYMKYLLAHRSRDHPESATVPLNLRCGECSRTFAHINSLRRHMRSHTGERNFLCNICGKSLSSREHLKFHIRIHTGYKPHECKVCGKGFTKKCNLTLHERVHTGEKPYVCQHCNKGFSQRSTLTIHLRYHSGARPYVCTLCNRGFVARGLLSMHLKTTCI